MRYIGFQVHCCKYFKSFLASQVAAEPTTILVSPWSQQNEEQRRRGALTSSMSAPVGPATRPGKVSPFERMDFNSQKAAGAVGWPADGPREARAFESLTSYNAKEAMLSVSAPEEETGADKAASLKKEAAEAQQIGTESGQAAPGRGIYRREILPRLR